MYIILLSGGSGKRLWPLSNDLRSKQYIKLLTKENNPEQSCSMVQRVMAQLQASGLDRNTVVCASTGQVELLKNQLGDIHIAVEPDRRDTFPAVLLSCCYLISEMKASAKEVVCVLPVDPYTEKSYFDTLYQLAAVVEAQAADIALMGAEPTCPSVKYGYIVPGKDHGAYQEVSRFREKPDAAGAEMLLREHALWNCGVFCFQIGRVLSELSSYGLDPEYGAVCASYQRLPKISFDYQVLEKAARLAVVPFRGLWKDLGTWNALSEEMRQPTHGQVITDGKCEGTHVINELEIPMVTMGLKNIMVVASLDGILVADKGECDLVKNVIGDVKMQPMYEERRWGTLKTIDVSQSGDQRTVTRKITIFKGMNSSYHYHEHRDEIWTVMRGKAELMIEGVRMVLEPGAAVSIKRGQKHAVKAIEEFEYMEIHLGETVGDQDINRITFDWESVPRSRLL